MLVKTKRLTSVHHYDPNSRLFSGFTTFSLLYVFSSQIQFKMSHCMVWLSFTSDSPPLSKCSLLCTFPLPHTESSPKGTPVFLMILIPLPQTWSNVTLLSLPGLMKNNFFFFAFEVFLNLPTPTWTDLTAHFAGKCFTSLQGLNVPWGDCNVDPSQSVLFAPACAHHHQ